MTAAKVPTEAPKEKGVWLWSPKGNQENGDTQIALTNGHTLVISGDRAGTKVPLMFRKEAISRGCIPVGMEEEEDQTGGFDRIAAIRGKIQEMLVAEDRNMFTTDGKPSLTVLARLCGFQLDRNEVNRVWDEMMKESAKDDDGPGGEVISAIGAGKK